MQKLLRKYNIILRLEPVFTKKNNFIFILINLKAFYIDKYVN